MQKLLLFHKFCRYLTIAESTYKTRDQSQNYLFVVRFFWDSSSISLIPQKVDIQSIIAINENCSGIIVSAMHTCNEYQSRLKYLSNLNTNIVIHVFSSRWRSQKHSTFLLTKLYIEGLSKSFFVVNPASKVWKFSSVLIIPFQIRNQKFSEISTHAQMDSPAPK